MKRLSQEVVEQRLKDRGIEYEPFTYTNNSQIIQYKCPICKIEKTQKLDHIFKQSGCCVSCGNRKYTQDTIEEKIRNKNIVFKNFIYESTRQKIEVKCQTCDEYKFNTISNLIGGRTGSCMKCAASKPSSIRYNQSSIEEKLTEMGYTFEKFVYKTVTQRIRHKCPDCDVIKEATITNLLREFSRCKNCGSNNGRKKTAHTQEYVEAQLTQLNIKYKPFVYISNRSIVSYKCGNCDDFIESTYHDLHIKKSNLCNRCLYIAKSITIDDIKNKLNELGLIFISAESGGSKSAITYECPSCNVPTISTYNLIQQNGRITCRACAGYSSMEIYVDARLVDLNIAFKREHSEKWLVSDISNRNLYLDFYLEEYNVAIECQGEQHFRPIKYFGGVDAFKNTQYRDSLKKSLCEEHGIKLYYINYNENTEEKLKEILLECGALTVQ